MAWIYLAESGGSHLPWLPGCAQSPIVKTTDMPRLAFCPECGTALFHKPPYGMMCEVCLGEWSAVELISFTEASPARTSRRRDLEKAWQGSEAAYFSRSLGSLKKSTQLSFFSKTSPSSEAAVPELSAKDWPVYGMICDGALFPLSTWERRTKGTAGFCSEKLAVARAQMWPTPAARDYRTPHTREHLEEQIRQGHGVAQLNDAVAGNHPRWPTVRASDGEKGQRSIEGAMKEFNRKKNGLDLGSAVKLFPTATARDWKSGSKGKQGNSRPLSEMIGGQLNPTWVEWLMGYPLGWTELEDWAMQWFRSKRGKRSKD